MNEFCQQEGIECIETISPVEKMNNIRLILSLVVCFGWKLYQMGVNSVFLHEDLSE
jgi:hypothetical protein